MSFDFESRLIQGVKRELGEDFRISKAEANKGYELLPRAQVKLMAYSSTDSWDSISKAADIIRKIITKFTRTSLDEEVSRLVEELYGDEMRQRAKDHEAWMRASDIIGKRLDYLSGKADLCPKCTDEAVVEAWDVLLGETQRPEMSKVGDLFNRYAAETWRKKPMARLEGFKNGDIPDPHLRRMKHPSGIRIIVEEEPKE